MERQFKLLTEPIQVGPVQLKHRMVMGPMRSNLCMMNGEVSQQILDYYAARAKSNPALIIIESTAVDGRYGWTGPTLRLDTDDYLPGMGRLVEIIHRNGAVAFIELINTGAFSTYPISPSGVPMVLLGGAGVVTPRAMTLEEVEEAREKYIATAVRAKEVGAEGVLLHGATSYFLHDFLSPISNKRTDKYGGNLENRMRLSLEIVRGIRQKCGPNFAIGYEIVIDEFLPGGITIEQSMPFAKALKEAGLNYLDGMVATYETLGVDERTAGDTKYGPKGIWEYWVPFKKALNMPVFHRAHGDYDPVSWEKHLESGDADVVQVAKQLLCDPQLFRKVLEGRLEDIRPCVLCQSCSDTVVLKHFQVSCALNPETGRERDYAIQRVSEPKKVLVVGAGPAGLEAARVAALRGHEVTLLEKEAELGGNMRILSLCLGNDIYKKFRDWEVRQCNQAGVKTELNKEVTPEAIQKAKPDVVILATGAAKRIVPDIPGISKKNVVNAEDVLTERAHVGKKVVIIGGNRIGVDTAYTIAKKGWADKITIVEPLPVSTIGYDMEALNMARMVITLLPKFAVEAFTGTQVAEITDDGVAVTSPEGKKQKIKADTVILALGFTPDKTLYQALAGKVKELYAIEDSVEAWSVAEAVHAGAYIARQI
jgi:2,4-dienoyl-CoA reductase-like NADH-dependent reductase (Old Yellow Enzyme family)/NADPH-dependent 2,4-dienoyl-CoA reductase/sulfur reductase-like enzyme